MNQFAGMRVGEALTLLPGAQLLAGADGLNRVIQSVGLMEAPDALQFMKAGDLVLTALWAIRQDREAQLRLVPELVRRGAAGLAVKQRYVGVIPEEMLAQANYYAFPLLELTADMPFSAALLPVIGQIVNRQAMVLARQQKAHKAVMQAVLEAKGLQRLAETLAELVENPVVIRDHAGQVLAVGQWGDGARDLDLAQAALLAPQSTDYMLSASDTVHGVEVVVAGGRRLSRVVTPIKTGNSVYGQVQAWEAGRPLGELDLSIIDSVTTVIALELANRRALMEVERRYHNEFLASLFTRPVESEADLLLRARRFGWDLTRPYYTVALRARVPDGGLPREEGDVQQLHDRLYDLAVKAGGSGAIVGQVDQHTVLLMPPRSRGDAREEALAMARTVQAQAQGVSRLRISLGVGGVQSGIAGLRRSFQEARQAISIGERIWGPGTVAHYADLGLYQILAMLEPTAELQQFLTGIRRLMLYDAEHRTDLVKTLETYFACKGNVRRVSAELYAHYNTVLYRLQRIEEITGLSLEDASGRLALQVALQAAKLFP